MRAQPVLFPLARVGAHVHGGLKAQLSSHNSDGEPEISRGADGDGMAREQLARGGGAQHAVVAVERDQLVFEREAFGEF